MKQLIIKCLILLVPVLVIMATSGCNSTGTGKKPQATGITSIHINHVDVIKDQINISHIADKIEYIPLPTTLMLNVEKSEINQL